MKTTLSIVVRRRARSAIPFLLSTLACLAGVSARQEFVSASPSWSFALVENLGQWPAPARFVASGSGDLLRLEEGGFWWQSLETKKDEALGVALRFGFAGAKFSSPRGDGRLPGVRNYYLGSDRSAWREDVRSFARVVYPELWSGIDLIVRTDGGTFEYDIVVCPGARLEDVAIEVEGCDSLEVTEEGRLRIHTALGALEQTVPAIQIRPSVAESAEDPREPITARFRVLGPTRFGFDPPPGLDDYVVDPGLIWSSYLGGSWYESGGVPRVIAEPGGIVTLCGTTESFDFPVTPGTFAYSGWRDAFVSRIDTGTSSPVFSTCLGGNTDDTCRDLALSPSGATIVVTGDADSDNFPTTSGALDETANDNPMISDVFVTRLDAATGHILVSTYVGGLSDDYASAVAVSSDETVLLLAKLSSDFPTTPGVAQPNYAGGGTRITRLSPDLSAVVFSTYYGGTTGILESGSGIAEHPDGTIYVAGNTTSLDLPGAQLGYDSSFDDSQSSVFSDAYVARLSGDGTQILSATYLGGPRKDGAGAPAVDAMGRVIVCGSTLSSSFPTTPGAVQPGLLGLGDGFIAALSADLSSLLASTYWGASGDFGTDFTVDLVSDGSGVSTIVGETTGTSFVTTAGAFMAAPPSIWTGYITRLSPGLDIVLHSTVVGGLADFGPEYFSGVASLPSGRVAAVGQTYKPDFPVTPNALQPTLAGLNDVTVSVLELQPTGVSAYGFSTPSCLGEITVGADRLPSAGSTDFHLYCSAAPPSAIGFLGLGAGQVASGLPLLGITVFLDPALPLFLQPVVSDQQGFLFHPLPLPAGTSGQTFYAQFAWIDAPGCVTPQGLSASFALAVTIQ